MLLKWNQKVIIAILYGLRGGVYINCHQTTFDPLLPVQLTSLQFFQKATKFHIGRFGMCCDHSFIDTQETFFYTYSLK